MNLTLADIPTHDHPAVYSEPLIPALVERLTGHDMVVDGFSGCGRIHYIAQQANIPVSVGCELEPEWSNADLFNKLPRLQLVGDTRILLPQLETLCGQRPDAFATSCVYGNRMSDRHIARDICRTCNGTGTGTGKTGKCGRCKGSGVTRRGTYTHRLGRGLTPGNAGEMQWGPDYRILHAQVWGYAVQVLQPGGTFIFNCKNHIRKGGEVDVIGWHLDLLEEFGLRLTDRTDIECPGLGFGSNHDARTETESVVTFRKPKRRERKPLGHVNQPAAHRTGTAA